MTIKDLIGYQLVSIYDTMITVRKGNSIYELYIEQDYGGCCGFNEVSTSLLISETEVKRNPVITDVVIENGNGDGYQTTAKITFFGEYKTLAELNALSSSGSGWCYGASVSVVCKALDMEETITQY